MNTPEELSQTKFAHHIGAKPSHVTQLKADGRLVMSDDGKRVRVAESIARIHATRDPSKSAVAERHAEARGAALPAPDPMPEPAATHDYQDARAKREHYAALTEEMNYRRAAGELMEAGHVKAALADTLTVLRNALETLPDILAPQLAPVADEAQIRARLADEVEIMLTQVSERFAEMGRA